MQKNRHASRRQYRLVQTPKSYNPLQRTIREKISDTLMLVRLNENEMKEKSNSSSNGS